MPLHFKRILVPTDFSDISLNALDYAAAVARNSDAEVTLLHVYESYEQHANISLGLDINEIIEKGINDKIDDIKATNKNLWGVKFNTKVVNGKSTNDIIKTAKQLKSDLIVMGTHGTSGLKNLGKYLLGSNAYRVVNNAPCPVVTIREKKSNIRFKDILLPIDNTKETKMKLDMAIQWAKDYDATIHLVALTAFFEELFVEIKDLKKMIGDIETKLEKAGVKYTSKMIRHQRASESVITYAEKIPADLIIMVTGHDNQWSKVVVRSAARNIITESTVPVLSINADKV